MTRFKSALPLVLLATTALALTGCETYHNSVGTMKGWFTSDEEQVPNGPNGPATAAPAIAMAATPAATCLSATVVEDLASLRQFSDESATREENRISSIKFTNAQTKCEQTAEGFKVTLDMTFDGDLGPKGVNNGTVSYPFFVAVTGPDGSIKSKEIHTLSITYPQGQNMATVHEVIQLIPAADEISSQGQQILLGFQLTDGQLVYNRTLLHAANPSDPKYATPTQSSAPKAEEKPKPKKKPPLPTHKPSDLVPAQVVEETPVETAPAVEDTTTAPVDGSVIETTPTDATATETAPAAVTEPTTDATTTETAPATTETVPEAAPVETPATDAAPAETAPAEATPAEAEPADSTSSTTLDELFDKTVPAETTTTPAQ